MSHEADRRTRSKPDPTQGVGETGPARRIHWRSGLGILLGGVIAETVVLSRYADDSTMKIYVTLMYVFPIVAGLLILWWLFRSGFSRKTRLIGLAVAAAPVVSFFLLVRIERFEGDMWPVLAWRWEPTAEELAAAFWEKRSGDSDESPPQAGYGAATLGGPGSTLRITEDDWPRFRGPRADGVVRGVRIRTDWKENPPKEVWRHPVGPAWSSFAVVGDRLFTQEQRQDEETVVCYDARTGRELWVHEDEARYETTMGGIGPRATPTVHASRLYALGATGILNCLNPPTGELLWSRNILEDAGEDGRPVDAPPWGVAGSPLVFDGTLVVNAGGEKGRAVIAYDRLVGQVLWANGEYRAGYAAPRLETIRGREQIVIFDSDGVAGYDPATGAELWRPEQSWTNSEGINVAQPIVREQRYVLISSGYGVGSALLEVDVDESGKWSAEYVWQKPARFKLKFNGAVYKDGYVYGLDEGILACIEYKTGQRQWKGGRYGHGQLLLIDEHDLLLVQAEKGDVVLVEAVPDEHREVTRFTALDDTTWNHPVLNRGYLFVRNYKQAACYDLRAEPEP